MAQYRAMPNIGPPPLHVMYRTVSSPLDSHWCRRIYILFFKCRPNAVQICGDFDKITTIDNKWLIKTIISYCIVLYCIVLYCIVLYCIVLYCMVCFLPEITTSVNSTVRASVSIRHAARAVTWRRTTAASSAKQTTSGAWRSMAAVRRSNTARGASSHVRCLR